MTTPRPKHRSTSKREKKKRKQKGTCEVTDAESHRLVAAAFGSARGSDSPPIKTTGDLAAPIPGIQQHIPDKRSKSSSNLWQPCRTAGASPGSASDSPPRGPLRLPGAGRGVAAGALRRRQAARLRRVRARRLPALAPGDTAPAAVRSDRIRVANVPRRACGSNCQTCCPEGEGSLLRPSGAAAAAGAGGCTGLIRRQRRNVRLLELQLLLLLVCCFVCA